MVGWLLSNRLFNSQAMCTTMKLIWKPAKNMIINTVDENCFLFKFAGRGDLDRVHKGRPWFFDRHVVLLDEIGVSTPPRRQVLETTPFWIRLYDLSISA